jgi:hypothetical protein
VTVAVVASRNRVERPVSTHAGAAPSRRAAPQDEHAHRADGDAEEQAGGQPRKPASTEERMAEGGPGGSLEQGRECATPVRRLSEVDSGSRPVTWFLIGLVVYFAYSYSHSALARGDG